MKFVVELLALAALIHEIYLGIKNEIDRKK